MTPIRDSATRPWYKLEGCVIGTLFILALFAAGFLAGRCT